MHTKTFRVLSVAAIGFLIGSMPAFAADPAQPSSLLEKQGEMLVTTHSLPFRVSAGSGFTAVAPVSHSPEFHGHPFFASIGMLAGKSGEQFVMVHAERVMDGKPALVYKDLSPATLDDVEFGKKRQCATVDTSDLTEEFDLHYLSTGGAKLQPAVLIEQYFRTNPAHTEEFIVTLGVRLPDCDPATIEKQAEGAIAKLRAAVKIKPI